MSFWFEMKYVYDLIVQVQQAGGTSNSQRAIEVVKERKNELIRRHRE